ncbi:MAG: ABC transporter ATP-binding protein [Eubacterium sp.]|nr:ABC transporter ATP-binding protein [Eubacterium sp.]
MLIAKNLVKSFYKTEAKGKKTEFNAVDGISLSADRGEILGILGPNGAGKTTLLRMLSGLMKPTSGTVRVISEFGPDGKIEGMTGFEGTTEVFGRKNEEMDVKKSIGYLSGNTKLYGRMSVRELLNIFGTVYGLSENVIKKRIDRIVEVLDMEGFVDNRIERLSTGQTQRASIARTLIHDPEIYIFDEPTLGLDIISSKAIIEFMKKEKERGKTVIYSTHYMEEAEYLCDRIIMLNKGKTICNNSPAELKAMTESSDMRETFYKIIEREGISNES